MPALSDPGFRDAGMISQMERRILIVDDDADVLAGMGALLKHSGWDVSTAASGREAFRMFESFDPDVVLLDVGLPDVSGIDVLDHIKRLSESTAVIVMSGVGTIDLAVEAMRLGAETFVSKPCDFDSLEMVLQNVSKVISTRRELEALKHSTRNRNSQWVGISEIARSLDAMIDRVAAAPASVLLEGESGTGKGLIARLIHERSPRNSAPFIDLNCAGLSKELLESELFGYERGAFTDARNAKPGLLEIAESGTAFLDEIGELEISLQARLLKALEDKKFRRLGGIRDLHVDFRLIAASNKDLQKEVAQGNFRRDLYYRLNVLTIRIPPLRERLDDVPLLAQTMLATLTRTTPTAVRTISDRAMKKLQGYAWPGNVRELRNVLERAVLTARGKEILVEDLFLDHSAPQPGDRQNSVPLNEWDVQPLEKVTAEYVQKAVDAVKGNIREAARRLGVSPSTIYAKLKKKE